MCYTTWDDIYFYAAFRVDDPDLTGTNKAPFSNPWEDDSVEVFLEITNKHAETRTPSTFSMAVSAAGGATFTQGKDDGTWETKRILTFKYAVNADGSLNNHEDFDVGYAVELAIPWNELGVSAPTPGTMMSFNVVVRQRGEADGFVSLSPHVKSEEDIQSPAKWVNIVFTGPSVVASTLSQEKIVSAKYIARRPLIDGRVHAQEYNKNTSFDFLLPSVGPSKPRSQIQRLLLTYYYYWYQADTRKAAPTEHVREENQAILLTDKPIRGAGPWFSYDRVRWHKDELSDMRRAGIDVVLPVYRGNAASRAGYAAKGLDCMVEALRQLQAEKRPYPLVGMFFDTESMTLAYGSTPDMKSEDAKRTFYGMVKDFFSRIPEGFRAQVQMSDERADRPCYIIDLNTSNWLGDVDSSLISYVNERFRSDFDANLLWLGATDFKEKAPVFDGYCDTGAGLAFGYDESAKIRIASIGPGYDDTAIGGRNTPIRARNGGDTYRTDWDQVLSKNPNWIVVDNWNGFHEGTEICASREYGYAYVDATTVQSLRFRGGREYDAKYLRHNMASVIAPGVFWRVDIHVQNDGTKPWKAGDGYALSYRWYQDGALVAESAVKRPLQQDILPGHSVVIPIGVVPIGDKTELLPEGDYQVRFEMVRMSDNKWFSSLGDEGFIVPVRVGKPQGDHARFTAVDGPVMMKAGTDYPFTLTVRNDGDKTWPAGTTKITCKLYRVSNYISGSTEDSREEMIIAPVTAAFVKDTSPGQVAEVELLVNLKDRSGAPIPVWKQSDLWSYQLVFGVSNGSEQLPETCAHTVDALATEYGANIIATNVSDTLDAGKTYDVNLVVKNPGPDPWKQGSHGFGYHWYHLDGTEALWDGVVTPMKGQIKPGESQIVSTKLTAPAFGGRYILAWDMSVNGTWASTSDLSRGSDLLTQEVTVKDGRLVFVDMSKLFDTPAMSTDTRRDLGKFDNRGFSFPAEMMPPDIGLGGPNDIYPSGYYLPKQGEGQSSPKMISFKLGASASAENNALTCNGQTLTVPKSKYARAHILAAAVEPNQVAEFKLGYDAGAVPARLKIASWLETSTEGETVAFATEHRHYPSGDERGVKCSLFHYVVQLDPNKPLTSLVMPENDKVRVLAVTLEK